jgi:hypothetical protein
MATYRVDSIHLGLQVKGDCSIHLLIQDVAQGGQFPLGKVLKAVLIDGGDRGERDKSVKGSIPFGGQDRLKTVLGELESPGRYDLTATNGKLQFDAVVITHWHLDHWAGVIYAIVADLRAQHAADASKPLDDIKVSFFKYKADKTPETILYCPGIGWGFPTYVKNRFPALLKGPNIPRDATPLTLSAKVDGGTYTDIWIMKSEPETPADGTKPSIIGTNLFTGNDLGVGTDAEAEPKYALVKGPAELVQTNPPDATYKGSPGLYILSASNNYIGGSLPAKEEGSPKDVIDKVDNTRDDNWSSIAAMVIWPSGRLSHYLAGDMHWDDEIKIVDWVLPNVTEGDQKTVGNWVTVMKASHHGSKESTPMAMIEAFNPRHIVISAFEMHGHPSK